VNTWLRDFAFGIRTLRKNPAFAITALVTLALGIGATTAIFSVVNAVLLRPLPYKDPGQLVLISADLTKRNVRDFPLAPGDLRDMQLNMRQLSGITGFFSFRISLVNDDGTSDQIRAAFVTTNFFSVLGGSVAPGRDFTEADGILQRPPVRAPGDTTTPPPPPPNVAILGYEFWQRRFGGDPKIIGTLIPVGGGKALVAGIAPPRFELLVPPRFGIERTPDIFVAARPDYSAPRNGVLFRAIGRMKPGVTFGAARAELQQMNNDFDARFPGRLTSGNEERMEPLHQELVGDVKSAVLALMGGVMFVLLIACANVANLILVRTSRRERELAVRAAMGGSRSRLIRQMLAEAMVLGVSGAALGLVLAEGGISLLLAMGPAHLPRVGDVTIDPQVLGFAVLVSMVAVVLFGVVPAIRASRPDLMFVLRSSGRNAGLGGGGALRSGVAIAEVTLAFVLLIGSGLMLRSFVAITHVDPGFDSNGVVEFTAQKFDRDPNARNAWIRLVQQRLSAMTGVTAVTAAATLPFDGDGLAWTGARWGTEEAISNPDKYQQGDVYTVIPGYFAAIRTRLIEGRAFTDADNVPTATTIIIDRTLAQKAFPGQSAVGKRLSVRFRTPEAEFVTVIGVVDHAHNTSLSVPGREAYFVTDGEQGFGAVGRWVVRSNGDAARLMSAVRAEMKSIDATVPVTEMKPMDASLDIARAPTRFALILIGIFAGIAALLSAVGLYGVLSSIVRERTNEIGVRVALGAERGRIFRLVIGQGVRLSAIGITLGLASAFALTRAMRTLLVGVSPTDPLTFVAISAVFFAIAMVACWLPARRAAGLDPITALRDE
jgi:predicted permease